MPSARARGGVSGTGSLRRSSGALSNRSGRRGDRIPRGIGCHKPRFHRGAAMSSYYTENGMRIGSVSHSLLMLIAGGTASLILAAGSARAAPRAQTDLVEFEKMTWVEVKSALAAGKTTALLFTRGG